jgi:hypothetical protein
MTEVIFVWKHSSRGRFEGPEGEFVGMDNDGLQDVGGWNIADIEGKGGR